MSDDFYRQVLAFTESATSKTLATSQCLSALPGRLGRVESDPRESRVRPYFFPFKTVSILDGHGWEKETSAPMTPIQPLPGVSAALVTINTEANRGGDEIHSRGLKIKYKKNRGRNTRAREINDPSPGPPMANHVIDLI